VLIYLLQQQLKHASAHLPAATTIKTFRVSGSSTFYSIFSHQSNHMEVTAIIGTG
jgi:hypothetical protein